MIDNVLEIKQLIKNHKSMASKSLIELIMVNDLGISRGLARQYTNKATGLPYVAPVEMSKYPTLEQIYKAGLLTWRPNLDKIEQFLIGD